MFETAYFNAIKDIIERIFNEEMGHIEKAAEIVADAIQKGGMIHTFGTGHSMIIAEELFLRAGGLVYVNAILDESLSIMSGVASSVREKKPGYVKRIIERYGLQKGDVLIVASVSGVNAAPVEAAWLAKEKGCSVIAITSVEASSKLEPRNPLNKRLYEIADVTVDIKVPLGDAVVEVDKEKRAVPSSTIAAAFAANLIVAKALELLRERGVSPLPIWLSGNVPGSEKWNMSFVEKLMGRVVHLGIEEMMKELKKAEEKPEEGAAPAPTAKPLALVGRVITPFRETDGVVLIEDGKIVGLLDADKRPPSGYEVLEFPDAYIVPGLIDIHIHGCEMAIGFDGSVESLRSMARKLAKHGVTGFLPTGITLPIKDLVKMAKAVREAASGDTGGALILGMNSEGPFVNPEKKGALITGFMRKASIEDAKEILEASGGALRIMTVAPEIEGGMELVEWLALHGVTPSIGHSNATYEIATKAFDRGASHVTHLFNAMRGFHHRDPGLIAAALEREDVTVEIIADGIHVRPSAIRMAVKNKGYDGVIVISDATPLAGMPDGEYRFPGFPPITVKGGVAKLPDGTLAGSTLTLDRAVRFLTSIGIPLQRAIQMTSTNPARKLGLRKGMIKPGYDADITVFDKGLNVIATIVDGRVVWKKEE